MINNNTNNKQLLSNRKLVKEVNDLSTLFPELTKEWHPTKNYPLRPEDIIFCSSHKVWWKCSEGHEWVASIRYRSTGGGRKSTGCPYCSNKKIKKGFNDLQTLKPYIARDWNYQKNGSLTPCDVGPGSHKKVWWNCSFGHEWEAVIDARVRGTGCPYCESTNHTSFPEQAIFYYVKKYFPKSQNRNDNFLNNKMELDIFIPEIKTAIEYDGLSWHSSKESLIRETNKYNACREKEIKLIRISEKTNVLDIKTCDCFILSKYVGKNKLNKFNETIVETLKILGCTKYNVDCVQDQFAILEQYKTIKTKDSLANKCPELLCEWNYEKNKGILPNMFSIGSNQLVWWKCSKGHEWQNKINVRTLQHIGCPFCSGRYAIKGETDLATVNPHLAKEWHPTKNKGLKPNMVTVSSGKKVWWKCSKGHEWAASVYNRSRNNGCPYCSNQKLLSGYNDLATRYPNLAKEWHPYKNIGITPFEIMPNSEVKVWWKCGVCGWEWETKLTSRAQGSGCPKCSGKVVSQGENDLATIYPELAKEWNYERNVNILPSNVSIGSHKKVWWKCSKGHEWQTKIYNRTKGTNCPYCSGNKVKEGFNDLKTLNPELAKEWDYDNNNIKPNEVTINSSKKVWWKCNICGYKWENTISHRTHGQGCPKCHKRGRKK